MKNYVYINTLPNDTYDIYCKQHGKDFLRGVPKEFAYAILNDVQIKKLSKGGKRFEVEWNLYYRIIVFALRRYGFLECRSLDLLKYYVNHHTMDGQVIRTDEAYDTYEDFLKAYEGRLDDTGLLRYAAKIGYEYFTDRYWYWAEKWYYTIDECKFFQKKIIEMLPQLKDLEYTKLELTKDCELLIGGKYGAT